MSVAPNMIAGIAGSAALVLVVAAAMAYRIGRKARAEEISLLRSQGMADKTALRYQVHRADEAQELKAAEKRKADFAISEYFAANKRWNEAQGRVAELEAEVARLRALTPDRAAEGRFVSRRKAAVAATTEALANTTPEQIAAVKAAHDGSRDTHAGETVG